MPGGVRLVDHGGGFEVRFERLAPAARIVLDAETARLAQAVHRASSVENALDRLDGRSGVRAARLQVVERLLRARVLLPHG